MVSKTSDGPIGAVDDNDISKTSTPPTRPRTRNDCRGGIRPCPWVSCRHNLLVDVVKQGVIVRDGDGQILIPLRATEAEFETAVDAAIDSWDGEASCALDVVEDNPGGITLDEVGRLLRVTRERARQIESVGEAKVTGRKHARVLHAQWADVERTDGSQG